VTHRRREHRTPRSRGRAAATSSSPPGTTDASSTWGWWPSRATCCSPAGGGHVAEGPVSRRVHLIAAGRL